MDDISFSFGIHLEVFSCVICKIKYFDRCFKKTYLKAHVWFPCCRAGGHVYNLMPRQIHTPNILGLSPWLSGERTHLQCRRCRRSRFDTWVGKIPWRRAWQPLPVSLAEQSHGQRSLVGYSPWGCKESYTAETTDHIAHRFPLALGKAHQGDGRLGSLGRLWNFFQGSTFLFFNFHLKTLASFSNQGRLPQARFTSWAWI